jgi:uncharacterized protein (DUF486 family)
MEWCRRFARRSRKFTALDRGEPGTPPGLDASAGAPGTGEAPVAPPAPSVQTKPRIGQHIPMTTILLLTLSNIFMTFAWYGHLKYRHAPLFKVILISWLIAFAEYCFQVPANRIGSYEFTTAQLKTIQEVITLTVFSIFSVLYLREPLKWNYLVGFAMMIGAAAVIFKKW